ncbi:MAG: transposase [Candidatus Helarchaeota archaeon]
MLNSKQGLELLRLVSIRAVDDKNLSEIKRKYSHLAKDEALIKELKMFQDRLDEVEAVTFENDIIQLQFLSIIEKKQESTYYIIAKNNKQFKRQIGLLLTIPGVGPNTAVAIMAEIADVSYFPSPKKLVKWAGLAPKVYQSGHKKHITGKIHKGGNKYLRRAVVLACQSIYAKGKKTNPIKKYMLKIRERTDNYWKAICAGARKLLTIIWYMLKRNEYWGNFKIDDEIKEKLKEIFQHKIQLFQSKIGRYRKIMRRLNYGCDELLEGLNKIELNQRAAFKILVNSV